MRCRCDDAKLPIGVGPTSMGPVRMSSPFPVAWPAWHASFSNLHHRHPSNYLRAEKVLSVCSDGLLMLTSPLFLTSLAVLTVRSGWEALDGNPVIAIGNLNLLMGYS